MTNINSRQSTTSKPLSLDDLRPAPYNPRRITDRAAGFVDMTKLGKWNHDARANTIDWHAFAHAAVDLCESLGVAYKLKIDLAKYLQEAA